MDGLLHIPQERVGRDVEGASFGFGPKRRRTLRASIPCVGTGLHTGARVRVRLCPAPAGSGVTFVRTDLGASIPALYDRVTDTRLCTVLASPERPEARVGTVEHLMAALAGCGVTDATVEVDGPELPVLDGSAAPWVFLLDCAGLVDLDAAPRAVEVLRPVRVDDGAAFAELRPGADGLDLALSIAFDAPAIGRQALSLRLGEEAFRRELSRARTFAQAHEIEGLRAAGLARGGSLDNAVVVDGARVLNPAGLRAPDEFVRHKLLDAVGDLALAGVALHARFIGHRSGHALNNRLLRALFADPANWRPAEAPAWAAGAATRPIEIARAA